MTRGHLSSVTVVYDPEAPDHLARVTITCADCGVTELVFPGVHLSTLARVLASVMEEAAITGGGHHHVGTVADDTDTAAVEALKQRALEDLERRVVERATAKAPKH